MAVKSKAAGWRCAGSLSPPEFWGIPPAPRALVQASDRSFRPPRIAYGQGMPPNKLILIVEDNEDTRFVFSAILNYDGYCLVEAVNGEAGVACALAHRPI